MTLSFPPFTRAITWLLGINTAVFLLLSFVNSDKVISWAYLHLGLVPMQTIAHLEIWQVVTYSFIHQGLGHWFWNMLAIWMFGSTFESSWGTRRFLELFFTGVVGAALTTIALSFAHILGNPLQSTVGASGGLYAILMAYGLVSGENEIVLIPLPFLIKAKYFVAILILLTVYFAVRGGGGSTAYLAHLGGLFFGYLYVKYAPARGMFGRFSLSEWYYGLHNSYYRWKRRRAARKFEVYMRQHDRQVKFDDLGNFVPPEEDKKKNGGSKSGWVN